MFNFDIDMSMGIVRLIYCSRVYACYNMYLVYVPMALLLYQPAHAKRVHAEGRSFICHLCSAAFKTKDALKQHTERMQFVGVHLKDGSHIYCHLCPAALLTKNDLLSHMKIVHGQARTYTYPTVNLIATTQHDTIPPNECSSCQLGFVSSIDASEHFRVAHKNIYNSSNFKFVLRVFLRKCDGQL